MIVVSVHQTDFRLHLLDKTGHDLTPNTSGTIPCSTSGCMSQVNYCFIHIHNSSDSTIGINAKFLRFKSHTVMLWNWRYFVIER